MQYSAFFGWVTTVGIALLIVFVADLIQRLRTFQRRITAGFQKLLVPFMLADRDLLHVYRRFAVAVMKIAEHRDLLCRYDQAVLGSLTPLCSLDGKPHRFRH